MFSAANGLLLDLIALGALMASGVYVLAAARSERPRGRGMLVAGTAPLLVGLWALSRLGEGRWVWPSLLVAVLCAFTAVGATFVVTRAGRSVDRASSPTRWASTGLILVRLGLMLGVLVAVVVVLFGDGLERRIGDRVAIEKGYLAPGDPGARRWEERTVRWYADMVRLQLAVETPRGDQFCSPPYLDVREVDGRLLARERPSGCAITEAVGEQYGGTPVGLRVHKLVVDPPASVRHKVDALIAAWWLLAMLAALAVERLLARAVRQRPFDGAAVWWVRAFILAVAGLSIGLPAASDLLVGSLVEQYLPSLPAPGVSVKLWPLLFILPLLALAEVWRMGLVLQEEAEATV